MPVEGHGVRLSTLDTQRFGSVVARADEISSKELKSTMDFCESHHVELLIARCPVEDTSSIEAFIGARFQLMDTLVYYRRALDSVSLIATSPVTIEPLGIGEAEQVASIARECFADYTGHYHSDHRLDRNACTELYASWAQACCEKGESNSFVLVAGKHGHRVGFGCFRQEPPDTGELLLGAVLPSARGRGLYRDLTIAGMARMQAAGATRFVTSTHLSNWGAQAAWTAAGLRPYRGYHTFHRWFDLR